MAKSANGFLLARLNFACCLRVGLGNALPSFPIFFVIAINQAHPKPEALLISYYTL